MTKGGGGSLFLGARKSFINKTGLHLGVDIVQKLITDRDITGERHERAIVAKVRSDVKTVIATILEILDKKTRK